MTQYMNIAAIGFLALEILIIGIGILIGYRRGLGRTTVRAVYLAIIGTISFFVGRSIAASVTHRAVDALLPLLPDDIVSMLEIKPELALLLEHLAGALLVPFIFAILFGLLQLLTLICFKKVSTKLVTSITKQEERTTAGKWTGAAAGLVLGIVIAAVLLAPMYAVLHVVENTPEETITIFEDAIAENGMTLSAEAPIPSTALRVQPNTIALSTSPAIHVSSFSFVNEFLLRKLTDYTVPEAIASETGHESAIDSLPAILATAGDALYAYNTTAHNGGSTLDALTNAAAAVAPHLHDSSTIAHIAADALCIIGTSFHDNGSFMGIELPASENQILTSLVNNLVDTLSHTTVENAEANLISLFGKNEIVFGENIPTDASSNHGLLATMMKLDKDDPMKSLEDEKLSSAVSEVIESLAENESMSNVVTDIKDFAVDIIEQSDVDLRDERYQSLYEQISEELCLQFNKHVNPETGLTASVSQVAKDIKPVVTEYFRRYNVVINDFQTSVITTCIVQKFYHSNHLVDGEIKVVPDDLLEFFGLLEATDTDIDLPADTEASDETQASGDPAESEPADKKDDFDISDLLPDDFDINDLPEDFDINDLPEGFDWNDLPDDFDWSDLPDDFDFSDFFG